MKNMILHDKNSCRFKSWKMQAKNMCSYSKKCTSLTALRQNDKSAAMYRFFHSGGLSHWSMSVVSSHAVERRNFYYKPQPTFQVRVQQKSTGLYSEKSSIVCSLEAKNYTTWMLSCVNAGTGVQPHPCR